MDKTGETLILETRFIVHILLGLASSDDEDFDGVPREEIVHFLSMVKARLDELSLTLGGSGQFHSH